MKIIGFQPNPDSRAEAVGYLHDNSGEMPKRTVRPCVIVLPGGGYTFLSDREADPPATAFFAKGYQVFILRYSICGAASDLRPLADAALTVRKIRANSAEWNVFPDKIAVCGFSAGGHLAASLGTLWDSPELSAKTSFSDIPSRPDALILGYPVVTAGKYAHEGSIRALSGGEPTRRQRDFYSLEHHVSPSTPPAFLWHTQEDADVPVENTLLFAAALRRSGVPFECHIFRKGSHGLSMCNAETGIENPHDASWFPLCAQWLSELFGFLY